MLISVVSDTHGFIQPALQALKRYPTDLLCFLGDYYRDGLILRERLHLPGVLVMGNGDYQEARYAQAQEQIVRAEGVNIFCTHGHQLNVKQSLSALARRAQERGAHVALFGHTHCGHLSRDGGCWLMNPGSAAFPRNDQVCSMGLIRIAPEQIEFSIVDLADGHLIEEQVWQEYQVSLERK